jgi:phytoene synthase
MLPSPFDNPHAYCAWRTRQSGSSFYSSFYLLPAHRRRGMMALYAFCREVDDLVDEYPQAENRDHAMTKAREQLDAWQATIANFSADQTRKFPLPAHAMLIARALQETTDEFHLPLDDLRLIVQGMRMDLDFTPYADWPSLFVYCDRVAGVVGRLSARIFGFLPANESPIMAYASALGRALQLVNVLRDGQEDRARGRIYFPQHLWKPSMRAYMPAPDRVISPDDWLGFYHDDMVHEFFYHIGHSFDEAIRVLPEAEKHSQRAGVVMGRVYYRLFQQLKTAYIADPEGTRQLLSRSAFRLGTWHKWRLMASALLFQRNIND